MEKKLKVKTLDIEEGRPEVVLNEEDAKELGVHSGDRVNVFTGDRKTVAIVNETKTLVKEGELYATLDLIKECKLEKDCTVSVVPAQKPRSVDYIKRKMGGEALNEAEYEEIVGDVIANNLSEVELTAFISALYIHEMTMEETVALAKKMAETGEMLELKNSPVFDKHSLGGVPGNKITLLVVPIVAAAGLTIPKTSSRAITSACGTADIMEVLAPVTFNAEEIQRIVNKVGGIITWGGGVNLAPADDIFIRVEYPLSLDPHNLALCSVMAKKYAVGADYVVIDIPTGAGTKVETMEKAKRFAADFIELGRRLGITVECAITYGDKPIGRAVGPALEAREALDALEGRGPSSLIEKACSIAGMVLEAGNAAEKGEGKKAAENLLKSGRALNKMRQIIEEQGGDPKVTPAKIKVGEFTRELHSSEDGYVTHIDNKAVVKVARAAGAPKDKGAGLLLFIAKGKKVKKGEVLFKVFAESEYKLEQAVKLARSLQPVKLEGMLLERVPGVKYF